MVFFLGLRIGIPLFGLIITGSLLPGSRGFVITGGAAGYGNQEGKQQKPGFHGGPLQRAWRRRRFRGDPGSSTSGLNAPDSLAPLFLGLRVLIPLLGFIITGSVGPGIRFLIVSRGAAEDEH